MQGTYEAEGNIHLTIIRSYKLYIYQTDRLLNINLFNWLTMIDSQISFITFTLLLLVWTHLFSVLQNKRER